MTMDYTLDRAMADELLAEFGQAVTITPRDSGAYDTATGAVAVSGTAKTGVGAVLPLSRGLTFMGGSGIKGGDKQLLLSALDSDGAAMTAPLPGYTATIGGTVHTIVEVSPINPGGTAVLYDCVIRGAA